MNDLCDNCEQRYLKNFNCDEPCNGKKYFDRGYGQALKDVVSMLMQLNVKLNYSEMDSPNSITMHTKDPDWIVEKLKEKNV